MIAINQGKIANVEEMISEVQEVIDSNMAINQQMIADNQDRISANSKLVRKALQIFEVEPFKLLFCRVILLKSQNPSVQLSSFSFMY